MEQIPISPVGTLQRHPQNQNPSYRLQIFPITVTPSPSAAECSTWNKRFPHRPSPNPPENRRISRLPQVLHKSRHFCTTPSVLLSIGPPDTLLLTPMITIHPVNKPKPEPQTDPPVVRPVVQDHRRRQPEGRSRQNHYCHQLSRSPRPRRTQNPPDRLRPPGKLHRRARPHPR